MFIVTEIFIPKAFLFLFLEDELLTGVFFCLNDRPGICFDSLLKTKKISVEAINSFDRCHRGSRIYFNQ